LDFLSLVSLFSIESFLQSDGFVIGYYVLTVAASLVLLKETKKRLSNLKIGIKSIKYAPLSFGILVGYVIFAFDFVDTIPVLNWSWLGYNIALGPFASEGFWGVIPFIPLLIYMFIHINYAEEIYFRKSKKMVVVWALIHIGMGIKVHLALVLIPIGFLFKYVYDKKGLNHSYSMHFATNILVVTMLLFSFIS
jgi:membrane protease YdiL (CAAX protease family)